MKLWNERASARFRAWFGNEALTPAADNMSWLFIGAGAITLVNNYLPGNEALFLPMLAAIGAWSIAIGLVVRCLPWARWSPRLTLAPVPLAFALVTLADAFGGVSAYSYAVYFVVVFTWVGAHHKPGTSMLVAPLAAAAYVWPIFVSPAHSSALWSVTVAIPVCILVGESVSRTGARLVAAERESQRRADLITIGASAARRIHSLEPGQVFKILADAALELGACGATVILVDGDRATLNVAHAEGACAVREAPEQLVRAVLASQRTTLDGSHPVLVGVPVRGVERRSAILVAGFEQVPAAQDIEALELVASQAGPALENAERFRLERRAKLLAEVSSLRDPLTGAGNRRKGGMLLDQLRSGDAVVIVDFDNFKHVNDTRGHVAGDDLLRGFVSCAARTLRATDEVVRYGGDEFLLILPGGGPEADSVVERLRNAWHAMRPASTFSAGIAIRDDRDAPAVTLAKADRALYAAKNKGRDGVASYDDAAQRTA